MLIGCKLDFVCFSLRNEMKMFFCCRRVLYLCDAHFFLFFFIQMHEKKFLGKIFAIIVFLTIFVCFSKGFIDFS